MRWWKRQAADEQSVSPWISDEAAAAVVQRHGTAGTQWLARLEATLADAAVAHHVVLEDPIGGGTTGALVRAVTPGAQERGVPERRIVLKSSPDEGMLRAEAAALQAWGSPHAVEVLDEVRGGVLVLEHLSGGAENGNCSDEEILPQITALLKVIAAAPPHGYTLHPGGVLTKVMERLDAHDTTLHATLSAHRERIEQAIELGEDAQLCGLHGDLHSENTLWRGDQLTLIDPFPVTGPLAYDLCYWATDPTREGPAWDRLLALGDAFALPAEALWGYGVLGALLHLTYRTQYQVDLQRVPRAREILEELLSHHL